MPDQDAMNFKRIRILCQGTDGVSIWRRLDENRRLLNLLHNYAPLMVEACPYIEGYIVNADIFLMNLVTLQGLPEYQVWNGEQFPRPFPRLDLSEAYMSFPKIMALRMELPVKSCEASVVLPSSGMLWKIHAIKQEWD